jgi:single-strand DNA-binding protein
VDRNEVLLVGRLSAEVGERTLPSGDTLTTWRLIVRRPPRREGRGGALIDSIPCVTYDAKAAAFVKSLEPRETMEVTGAFRCRIYGPAAAKRWRYEVEVTAARATHPEPPEPTTASAPLKPPPPPPPATGAATHLPRPQPGLSTQTDSTRRTSSAKPPIPGPATVPVPIPGPAPGPVPVPAQAQAPGPAPASEPGGPSAAASFVPSAWAAVPPGGASPEGLRDREDLMPVVVATTARG